jgi:hypothetical protein
MRDLKDKEKPESQNYIKQRLNPYSRTLCKHHGGPGQSMCDVWWTKWHWERFSPSSSDFPCQYHSTAALHTNLILRMNNNKPRGLFKDML